MRREVLRRVEKRLVYRQVVQAQLQRLRRLKQERPQRTRTRGGAGGFSTKSGTTLSVAGGSIAALLLLLQTSPSLVLSSASSSDTTLGAFLLAFLSGSFLRWRAGRAAAAGGPTGGDWPWAAAISATEFGTVWEPAARLWSLAIERSSAILSFPSIISA